MQQLQARVPGSGTDVTFTNDRTWDGESGDSVLRVQGQSSDGGQVIDRNFTEVSGQQAQALGKILRALTQMPSDVLESITRDVQATFGSQLNGSDCHLLAEQVGRRYAEALTSNLGQAQERQQQINQLAERFERTAAQSRSTNPIPQDGPNGGGLEAQKGKN